MRCGIPLSNTDVYMLTGHTGMHVNVREFGTGIVDVQKALESIGVCEQESNECVGDSVVDEKQNCRCLQVS